MKLYMKQKVFSLKGYFTIKDEQENDKYYVEGEFPTIGNKLHVYDMNHNEIAFIKEIVLSFMGKYEVYVNSELVTIIKGKVSFIKEKLELENLGWKVEGNLTSHEYVIRDISNNEILSVSKAWFSWGDSYEIEIADSRNEVLAIAIVLAIDCVLESRQAASASAT